MRQLILIASFAICIPLNSIAEEAIVIDSFEHGLKPQWEKKEFKGQTRYTVIKGENGHVLKAESNASASALIFRYKYDLKDFPILSWKWKVENTIKKGDETKKAGDDYAARVYVIFPHWLPPLTKSINYIWANKLPEGKHVPNPFYSKAIMVAVESGDENIGKWIAERRNVYEDYKSLFGEDPPLSGGIAIMTDTDNTGESAVAYYDDIRIEKQ
ncbi:MAG: DUF3047 domain-containing protein [Deltaproteobacteria bacterium]|nr:DUF3047 domain-containing protein [Deltaproteobacteria bacterium]